MLTNLNLKQMVKDRARSHEEIDVAILGAGWFGRGLVYELMIWPGMEPRVIFDRTVEKAIKILVDSGVSKSKISVVNTAQELHSAVKFKQYVVSNNIELINDLPDTIDVFFDCTGNILAGTQTALSVMQQNIHFITISAEMDATIGFMLNRKAQEFGVIYSNSDGDQPGVLSRMITHVKLMGFDIAVAGNGKGFLNYHATEETIMPYVREGDNPRKIASFTDGSKQSAEMVVLANGTNLVPDIRGLHGVKTTKERLIEDVTTAVSKDGVVEYVMGDGVNLGMTVFVIGKRKKDYVNRDLEYLRMGKGPHYLFFRDYHLCYFESPLSIAEVVLFNKPTIAPITLNADVLSVAKKDIKAGEPLDGVGGYTCYGLVDNYKTTLDEKLLPLGLSEFAVAKKAISQDTPITYDMVDFPQDNVTLRLRREQDKLAEKGSETSANIKV